MFIEITHGKLVIEASTEEWKDLARSISPYNGDRVPREVLFAIHTILQQPKKELL